MKKYSVQTDCLIYWLMCKSIQVLLQHCEKIVKRSWGLITWTSQSFLNPDFVYWPLTLAVILSAWMVEPNQVSKGNSDRISATRDPNKSPYFGLQKGLEKWITWGEFLWQTENS